MRNIPGFISKQILSGQVHGELDSTIVFVDISGFTSMTESLSEKGNEGAEILSNVVNATFDSIINIVHENGGFIAGFAGDACTAVFNDFCCAVLSAVKMRDYFIANGNVETRMGNHEISIKSGLCRGTFEWGITGPEKGKSYYFSGYPIDMSAEAEHRAERNTIIVYSETPPNMCDYSNHGGNFYRIEQCKCSGESEISRDRPEDNRLFIGETEHAQGEFRDVVSLFLGFRNIKEFRIIDLYINIITERLKEYGGFLSSIDFGDKGHKVICFFGMPRSHENDVIRACRFADSLRIEFGDMMKAGMAKGRVFSGRIGNKERYAYTALGDSVNLAARIMNKAVFGSIFIDSSIEKHVRGAYITEFRESRKYKGKSWAVSIYELLEGQNSGKSEKTGFQGRESEIQSVRNEIDSLIKTGKCSDISIFGDAGTGKTRLFEEAVKYADANILMLKCDSITRKSLNPVIGFLKDYLNVSDANEYRKGTFEVSYRGLAEEIRKESPEHADEILRTESIIGALLGIYWENSVYDNIDPSDIEELTLASLKQLFIGISRKKPVIIGIDDIQWIDNETANIISDLKREGSNERIMVVYLSRYDDNGKKPALGTSKCIEIELRNLNPEAVYEMGKILLGKDLNDNVLHVIMDRTQGNPFYVEQFCMYMKDMSLDITDVGGIESSTPDNINSMIMARIDRLSTELRDTIQIASVLGKEFDSKVVETMITNDGDSNLTEVFKNGVEQRIWEQLRALRFIFSHILIRDVAYNMQLKSRIRSLHELAGNALIALYDRAEYYPDIAYHFHSADIPDRASEFYIKAGDHYSSIYKTDYSIEYYKKALSILSEKFPGNRHAIADLYLKISQEEKDAGHYELAIELADMSMVYNDNAGNETLSGIYNHKGTIYWNLGNYKEALEQHFMSLGIAEEIYPEDDPEKAAIISDIAQSYMGKGEHEKAFKFLQRALDMRKRLFPEGHVDVADSYNTLCTFYLAGGEYDKSLEYGIKAVSILKNNNSAKLNKTAIALNNVGVAYYYKNDFSRSVEYIREALDILSELLGENNANTALSLNNMGGLLNRIGRYDEAETYLRRAVNASDAVYGRNNPSTAIAVNNMGNLYSNRKDYVNAMKYYSEALRIRIEVLGQEHIETAMTENEIARILLEQDELENAVELLNKADSVFMKINPEHPIRASIMKNLAKSRIMLKDTQSAKEYLEKAYKLFRNNGDSEGMKTVDDMRKSIE